MMHNTRRYQVRTYDDLPQLSADLKEMVWTGCTGFRYRGLLLLNDSTGPDGAQEYAIVRERDMVSVESFTVSWMTHERFQAALREVLGKLDQIEGKQVGVTVEDPAKHGRCHLCA